MNPERIRAAAEWAQKQASILSEYTDMPDVAEDAKVVADLALIASKLAAGEWVLCAGKPALVREIGPSHYKDDVTYQTLHARITEES